MTSDKLAFISFKPKNRHFIGFLLMEDITDSVRDPETVLRKATNIYEHSITRMRSAIAEIQSARVNRKPIAARQIWQIGQIIFELINDIKKMGLQLDGVYDHLTRDLEVKRKWLEKVIIFRRYLPDKALIPKSLNWGCCEKGTRRIAQRLSKGLPID